MLGHRWATRHYRQIFLIFGAFLFEIVFVGFFLSENGTFGGPEAVLGATGQATKKRDCPIQNGTYGHIMDDPCTANVLWKCQDWGYLEPITAFPCSASWWAVPSRFEWLRILLMSKKKKFPFSGHHLESQLENLLTDKHFDAFFVAKNISSDTESFHFVSPFLVEKGTSAWYSIKSAEITF
ncbi:hypothetical protein AVEN_27989-1 [Araneus ventricosus]|uniref:Uncharacterized protein n=1 Tax=Araneus ventricosus TaxID=182803 RepID=A0A4Y2BF41_ARAVE|nr:hypothetical protein AVEN_27989-1 [Araneus ventricosus]